MAHQILPSLLARRDWSGILTGTNQGMALAPVRLLIAPGVKLGFKTGPISPNGGLMFHGLGGRGWESFSSVYCLLVDMKS